MCETKLEVDRVKGVHSRKGVQATNIRNQQRPRKLLPQHLHNAAHHCSYSSILEEAVDAS